MGKTGAKLLRNTIECQIGTLAAEGQLCIFQGEENLQVLQDLFHTENVYCFYEIVHVAAGINIFAAHCQKMCAHVDIITGRVGCLVGDKGDCFGGTTCQLHSKVAGNAQTADEVDIHFFVFGQSLFPYIIMDYEVFVPVQQGAIQDLNLFRIYCLMNALKEAIVFFLGNFHVGFGRQCITLAIPARSLICMDMIHGPQDGLDNDFLFQRTFDFRNDAHDDISFIMF